MWDLGEGAAGSIKERLRASYLESLDAVDKAEARRSQAMANGKFTPAGVTDDVLGFAASQLAPSFKRGRHVIETAKNQAKALRDKIKLDPGDTNMRRQEMRTRLLQMGDKERNAFISKNRDSIDPELALAIVEMPGWVSGVMDTDHANLLGRALRAQHGKAMDELAELEEAIAIAESAVETGRDEVREQAGVDAATFNAAAAPFEGQKETPWLRRQGEAVNVVDLGKGVLRPPTNEDLANGKFFKDKAEYDAANVHFIKNSAA
jgi:hypothetical protein